MSEYRLTHRDNSPVWKIRLAFDLTLAFATLFLPWWILVTIAFLGMAKFRYFLEALIAGFIFDLLYATPISIPIFFIFSQAFTFQYFFTAGLLIAMLLGENLKGKLRV